MELARASTDGRESKQPGFARDRTGLNGTGDGGMVGGRIHQNHGAILRANERDQNRSGELAEFVDKRVLRRLRVGDILREVEDNQNHLAIPRRLSFRTGASAPFTRPWKSLAVRTRSVSACEKPDSNVNRRDLGSP